MIVNFISRCSSNTSYCRIDQGFTCNHSRANRYGVFSPMFFRNEAGTEFMGGHVPPQLLDRGDI